MSAFILSEVANGRWLSGKTTIITRLVQGQINMTLFPYTYVIQTEVQKLWFWGPQQIQYEMTKNTLSWLKLRKKYKSNNYSFNISSDLSWIHLIFEGKVIKWYFYETIAWSMLKVFCIKSDMRIDNISKRISHLSAKYLVVCSVQFVSV